MDSFDENNGFHLPSDVLSFDDNKVRFILSSTGRQVEKISKITELKQIRLATDYLSMKLQPPIKNQYMIRVAPVMDWFNESILVTKFCEGDNCEHLMRNNDNMLRQHNKELIREVILTMRFLGFMWGDLCPRNIIVDNRNNVIWLVDFERELILLDRPAEKLEFSRHIRSYAWEEFSCFLFKEEKDIFFSDILVDEKNPNELIAIDTILSRRKRALLERLFGLKNSYTRNEIIKMQTLMADVATPFKKNSKPFFPMEIIDPWTCKFGGAQTYAELVLRLEKESEDIRYETLDKLSKSI